MKNLILKTSLLVYFLSLFVSAQAQETKLPPLQLKKGDTFSFLYKSSNKETLWMTFTIKDLKKSVYLMEVQMDRKKCLIFDTQDGFYNELQSPLLHVPIPFQITKNRQLLDLQLPKDIVSERTKDYAGEDLLKKMQLSFCYNQHKLKIKTLVESIFTNWNLPDAEINELSYSNNSIANQFHVSYSYKADSMLLSQKHKENMFGSFLSKENINGSFSVDHKSGMLTKASFKIDQTNVFYSSKCQSHQTVIIQPYSTNKTTTTLIAKVSDDYKGDELFAYLVNNFFIDKDLFEWKTSLEKGKTYITTQELLRPTGLMLRLKDGPLKLSFSNLLLEPGDSITININNDSVYFSGKGSLKNNIKTRLIKNELHIEKEWDEFKAKQICNEKTKDQLDYIEQNKNSISDWAYNVLRTDIYFGNQDQLLSYYYNHNNKMVNAESFNILMDTIDWDSYNCPSSLQKRMFLGNYLFRKGLILKGYKQNRTIPEQEEFYLAEMLFTGDAKYLAQTDIVWQALKINDTQIGNQLFQEYKKNYWQSEFYTLLNNLYANRVNLGANQKLPEVTFTTIHGKHLSTNDLKGKYIQLLFINIEYDYQQKTLEAYQKLKAEMDDKQFELITVFVTPDEEKIKEYIKEHQPKGILVSNSNWHIEELNQFNMEYGLPYFLVNPDGVIIFSGGFADSGLEHFLKEVKHTIEQTDFSAYEASISKRTLYSVLLVALLVVTIIVLVSILVMRNIKRKETLQRQKLEWQISAVRTQLNPHFLFNAMNSIQFLVNQNENKKANLFLSSFAKLMRKVLYQAEEEFTSLDNELDTIKKYLELEQLRHKFTFRIEVDPAIDLYNTEIPVMLIQPFVENAILHGIAELKDKGIIDISISKANENQLKICISDNGVGLKNKAMHSTQSNGKGMHLTQKRMDLIMQKYSKEITFEVNDRKQYDASLNGTLVKINIETEA